MAKFTLKALCLSLLIPASITTWAQPNRSIDGTGNNMTFPSWGAAHTRLLYAGTLGYGDGISEPGGADRPNPRVISNQLFSQSTLLNDPRGMSAYTWVWGQFIDHDITLVEDHPIETMNVSVPPYDVFFDPTGTGTAVIPMFRSLYDPTTGTSYSNFRKHLNSITAYIDGSGVYGSDETRANWLRSFTGGKLRLSSGNMLPFNTTTGEQGDPVDPTAPGMAMPLPFVHKWFVAGDPRANENAFLTAIHTLFAREHNRLCDELAATHPDWNDEQLYQQARKLNGAEIQAIVYEEWLPAMGMNLPPYAGYQFTKNPGIMNEFSAAAFRYGHTTINNMLMRMDHDGHTMPQGNILLRDAFFNPDAMMEVSGIEPYMQGMATVVQQDFDAKVIDDLRNFLFGQPGSGGMDLVSLNIQRGRERGVADYNSLRISFGLPPVENFSDINSDPLLSQSLGFVYGGDVDNIDAWVGIVSEGHMEGSMFGETAMTIIGHQFENLRDGDRYYYENDLVLTQEEKAWIKQTRLADVIRRNTSINNIQDQIFFAEPLQVTGTHDVASAAANPLVYPNPVGETLHFVVESTSAEKGHFQVVDMQGQVILQKEAALAAGNNMLAFDLPATTVNGIYILTVTTDNGQTGQSRFVKIGM